MQVGKVAGGGEERRGEAARKTGRQRRSQAGGNEDKAGTAGRGTECRQRSVEADNKEGSRRKSEVSRWEIGGGKADNEKCTCS